MKSKRGRWKWAFLFAAAVLFTVLLPQLMFEQQNKQLEEKLVKIPGSEKEQEMLGTQKFYDTEEILEVMESAPPEKIELTSMWTWEQADFITKNPKFLYELRVVMENSLNKQIGSVKKMISTAFLSGVDSCQLNVADKDGNVLKTTLWVMEFYTTEEEYTYWNGRSEYIDEVYITEKKLRIFVNPKDYEILLSEYQYYTEMPPKGRQWGLEEIMNSCKSYPANDERYVLCIPQQADNSIEVCYGAVWMVKWLTGGGTTSEREIREVW